MTLKLTSAQLCDLVELPFKRFETLRRRAREQLELSGEPFAYGDIEAIAAFPVRDPEPGRWSRFAFEDALSLGCVVELENSGLSWRAAATIVANSPIGEFASQRVDAPDFWIARRWSDDAGASHHAGTLNQILATAGGTTLILLNVSSVARKIVARATHLGLLE